MFGVPLQLLRCTSADRVVDCTARSSVPHHCNFLWLQGAVRPGFYSLRKVRFIAWHLRRPFYEECRLGLGYFRKCWARLGCSAAPWPTLKRPCAAFLQSVGRIINTASQTPVFGHLSSCCFALRSAGRGVNWTVPVGCASAPEIQSLMEPSP